MKYGYYSMAMHTRCIRAVTDGAALAIVSRQTVHSGEPVAAAAACWRDVGRSLPEPTVRGTHVAAPVAGHESKVDGKVSATNPACPPPSRTFGAQQTCGRSITSVCAGRMHGGATRAGAWLQQGAPTLGLLEATGPGDAGRRMGPKASNAKTDENSAFEQAPEPASETAWAAHLHLHAD